MKSLLLKNARKLHTDGSETRKSLERIKNANYEERILESKDDFLQLVWMSSENILGTEMFNQLTPRNEPRALKDVVKRIRDCYPYDSPHYIFEVLNYELSSLKQVKQKKRSHWLGISANNKWFENCIIMNGTFDHRLIGELWVRDLLNHELEQSSESKYYIEDGSHRALVYALNLDFNAVEYIPVKIRWCKSWRHIFPWAQEPMQ